MNYRSSRMKLAGPPLAFAMVAILGLVSSTAPPDISHASASRKLIVGPKIALPRDAVHVVVDFGESGSAKLNHPPAAAAPQSGTGSTSLVISQVYGNGG